MFLLISSRRRERERERDLEIGGDVSIAARLLDPMPRNSLSLFLYPIQSRGEIG